MFTEESFQVFQVEGLEPRMTAIRSEIQPVFQTIGEDICFKLTATLQRPFYLHIAQHRRRSVHPPENTWAAFSEAKRGYKMAPHFQVGIWPDYVFLWLSLIDQPKGQADFAQTLLQNPKLFTALPKDTVLNVNHTKEQILPATKENLTASLERLAKVKKAEFQIGRVIPKDASLWQDPTAALAYMEATYKSLIPLYTSLQNA